MQLPVDSALLAICAEIVASEVPIEEWRATESDDQFQREPYHGGFEASEDAFCFSYYPSEGGELWFQFTLTEAVEIAAGRQTSVDARHADR